MAVKLRLKKFGRRHQAFFRVSAMDCRSPRDGRVIEELGWYDPCAKDPEKRCKLDVQRVHHWLSVGAQPTETVRDLLKKQGLVGADNKPATPAPAAEAPAQS